MFSCIPLRELEGRGVQSNQDCLGQQELKNITGKYFTSQKVVERQNQHHGTLQHRRYIYQCLFFYPSTLLLLRKEATITVSGPAVPLQEAKYNVLNHFIMWRGYTSCDSNIWTEEETYYKNTTVRLPLHCEIAKRIGELAWNPLSFTRSFGNLLHRQMIFSNLPGFCLGHSSKNWHELDDIKVI